MSPSPRSSSRELRILRTIAEALNGAASVDEALQVTLEQVASLLGLETGWIWLEDPRTGGFYSAVAQQLPPFLTAPVRMTGTPCWCLQSFKAGKLRAGNIDVMECSRLREAVGPEGRAQTRGLHHHASIPLYFGERPLGIMNVAGPAWRRLTARELDLLSTIASQVGVAIERARLAREQVHAARIEERNRIAREIHDTLAQRLTAIGFHLEAALDALPGREARASVRRALDLSKAGVDEARDSMRDLRSPGHRPLADGVESLAHSFSGESGIRVHVRSAAVPSLESAAEQQVMRIVSEALANVRKHSGATDVEVRLRGERRRLLLEVNDNGRGFPTRARFSGYGITGMRERAQAIGGQLRITSAPGRGTRVRLAVPVAAPAAADASPVSAARPQPAARSPRTIKRGAPS